MQFEDHPPLIPRLPHLCTLVLDRSKFLSFRRCHIEPQLSRLSEFHEQTRSNFEEGNRELIAFPKLKQIVIHSNKKDVYYDAGQEPMEDFYWHTSMDDIFEAMDTVMPKLRRLCIERALDIPGLLDMPEMPHLNMDRGRTWVEGKKDLDELLKTLAREEREAVSFPTRTVDDNDDDDDDDADDVVIREQDAGLIMFEQR